MTIITEKIKRLQLLKTQLQDYISSEEFHENMDMLDLLEPNETLEYLDYQAIKVELTFIRYEKIRENLKSFFEKVNLRNFNRYQIIEEVNNLGKSHWEDRTLEEIELDKLLNIKYWDFLNKYSNGEKKVENERRASKNEVLEILKENFKIDYLKKIKEGKSHLFNMNDYTLYYDKESLIIYEQRSFETTERDTFSYITERDYRDVIKEGYLRGLDEFQGLLRIKLKSYY